MMQKLMAFFQLFKTPTNVLATGASPTLRRKASNGDLWGKSQTSRTTRTPRRPARGRSGAQPSIATPNPRSVIHPVFHYACSTCKEREARGEQVQCFYYLCRGCGERTISMLVNDRGFCEGCLRDVERGTLPWRQETASWEGSCKVDDEVPSQLAGQRALREGEVLRRAREGIDATSASSGASIGSTAAVVGFPERGTTMELLRERVESNCRARRDCLKLRLKKMCGNQDCGNVVVDGDGDGVMIRSCSEDSFVLVSLDHEQHNRLVSMEPVIFNAAQIGSPTGFANGTWPSPHMRDRQPKAAEEKTGAFSKRPQLWTKRGANLPSLSDKAINTSMSSPRIDLGIKVPPNTPQSQDFQWAATSNPIAIPRQRLVHHDQISELDISPPAHPKLYPESTPKGNWMDLLDHPSTPSSRSCSPPPPPSLLVEQPHQSLDLDFFSVPESLADSEFCKELVRTLSAPERKEQPRHSPTLTPTPSPIYPSGYPRSKTRRELRESADSEALSQPAFLPYDKYSAKLLSKPSFSTRASPLRPNPTSSTPTPSPVSESPRSLMFDFHYFDRIQHPHPHPPRTPSPAMTPYPSLCSSAASLELGFWSALQRRDGKRDIEATIHPRGCTPPSRAHSPGLEEWGNESVSLFGTTPEIGYLSDGTTVEIRSGRYRKPEYDNGNGSKLMKKTVESPSRSDEYDNHNGSMLLKRGGGKHNWLVMKMRDMYDSWRERERIKRELKHARMGDLKGIDPGPFVFGYAGKVKGKRKEKRDQWNGYC